MNKQSFMAVVRDGVRERMKKYRKQLASPPSAEMCQVGYIYYSHVTIGTIVYQKVRSVSIGHDRRSKVTFSARFTFDQRRRSRSQSGRVAAA